jgi:GDPmannose 4,6-dehydratase
MKTSLIFGVDGQVGSYLADLLLEKDYQVVGWVPDTVPVSYDNIQHILDRITLVSGDLGDQGSVMRVMADVMPDEVYNMAAPSFPAGSWGETVLVGDIAGLGVARILEAMRLIKPEAHFYQASTSELFGEPVEEPQNELTPFHPRNPYGIAKLYAHWNTVRYREHYGMYTVAGIMYNTESPRRGVNFVTRKIARGAARIKKGLAHDLHLGSLSARRDWGYAGDYVQAMWLMLQGDQPQDYVIGSGVAHSVEDFCKLAFAALDLDYREYVVQDPRFIRPPESAQLVADPSKAHRELGWQPATSFEELVRMMVEAEMERG